MPLPLNHFYMIRHGQTEANAKQVMAGSTDSPLTALGREQAQEAQKVVEALQTKPKRIVHSHLSRARDTAHIINQTINAPIYEDANLAEIHSGEWEGKPWSECESLLDGWPTPPNGEDFGTFCARIRQAKQEHISHKITPTLIVSHGGVFRGMGGIYGLNTPGIFANCHLYEFLPNTSQPRFPWDVFSYGFDGNGITKKKETIFHDSPQMEDHHIQKIIS